MRRGQVLVRAIKADGRWGAVDALDLDDESFRAWVLSRLFIGGLITCLPDEVSGDLVALKERKDE